jgi:hypothetical protein
MQATALRRPSIEGFVIALAVAAVLILGAAGGYWLRSLAPQATTTVTVARAALQSSPTGSSQGLFGSSNALATNGGASAGRADDLSTHRSGIQY